jgi:hypothetical protein
MTAPTRDLLRLSLALVLIGGMMIWQAIDLRRRLPDNLSPRMRWFGVGWTVLVYCAAALIVLRSAGIFNRAWPFFAALGVAVVPLAWWLMGWFMRPPKRR